MKTTRRRECVICGELLSGIRRKYCSESCKLEAERRAKGVDDELEMFYRARQMAGTWDYDESDPYPDLDDELFRIVILNDFRHIYRFDQGF